VGLHSRQQHDHQGGHGHIAFQPPGAHAHPRHQLQDRDRVPAGRHGGRQVRPREHDAHLRTQAGAPVLVHPRVLLRKMSELEALLGVADGAA